MPFFESLKEFVRVNFNINIQIGVKQVYVNTDLTSQQPIEFNERNGLLTINRARIPEEKWKEIKPLIKGEVKDQGALILAKKSKERIEDIELKERTGNEQSILSYFKSKIPPDDYTALRASLYLKQRFEEGASRDEITQLKTDIIKRYSQRGRNISDLCSAGYFTLIKNLNEEIKRSGGSKEDFYKAYNFIVEEGALTIFVSEGHTDEQIKREIENKIRRNKHYGLHFLFIHGIGRSNVEKIWMVLYDLKESHPELGKSISEYANIIAVKLTF